MKIKFDNFIFAQCTLEHLQDILHIQHKTLNELSSPDILRVNSSEMLEQCLNQPHFTVGAWYNGVLAGFSVLYCPQDDQENLAIHLQGVNIDGFITANNKLCIISKEFRGNSLQYHLGLIIERRAIDRGIKLLCTTVSPKNFYSIRNVQRLGYVYNKTFVKYGFERNLYYKFI